MIKNNKSKSEEEIIIKLFMDNLWVITKINHGLCRIPHYLKVSQAIVTGKQIGRAHV